MNLQEIPPDILSPRKNARPGTQRLERYRTAVTAAQNRGGRSQCAAVGARHAIGQRRIGPTRSSRRLIGRGTSKAWGRPNKPSCRPLTELAKRAMSQQLQTREGDAKRRQRATVFATAHGPRTPRGVCHCRVSGCSSTNCCAWNTLFRGTLSQTSVYPREVVLRALHPPQRRRWFWRTTTPVARTVHPRVPPICHLHPHPQSSIGHGGCAGARSRHCGPRPSLLHGRARCFVSASQRG